MQDLRVEEHPGMHRYASPQGLPELLEAIADRIAGRTGQPATTANVLVAAGATGALGAIVGAIAEPGDEVLLVAPYWPLIAGIVTSFHGKPLPVPFFGEVDSAETAIEALERHVTDRTVALYYNTPNNPSGQVLPRAWLEAMVDWARRRDLWLLSDDVYEDYVYEGEHLYTRSLEPERTLSIHSCSKAFGMAGNRCGYVVGAEAVMGEIRKVSTHTFYSTPTAAQLAALRAFGGPGDEWIARARTKYTELGRWAAGRLGLEPPGGSTFLFLDVADRLDERGLFGFLEDCVDRGLFVAPGPSFGLYPTHVRLCYTAAEPAVVKRGVGVLAELLGRG